MPGLITVGTNGWCDVEDVLALLPTVAKVIRSNTSHLTEETIAGFITDGFRLINARLTLAGMTLSALDGDTTAEAVLKPLNVVYAVLQVLKARATDFSQPDPMVQQYQDEWERYEKLLGEDFLKIGAVDSTQQSTVMITASMRDGGDGTNDYSTTAVTRNRTW